MSAAVAAETIVTVHGLGRSRYSMSWLAGQFKRVGYAVVNVSYPSTRLCVLDCADALQRQIASHLNAVAGRIHFVTHSLGGIVVRALLRRERPSHLGRVVMLAPPNQGSELPDRLASNPFYRWALGPAGQELGTHSSSTPNQLGPVDYDVGIIAGQVSLNPLFSSWIAGPNDGKVSVARAAVAGQRDFLVVPRSHTFLMRSREVADQSLHFIAHGHFQRPASSTPAS